MCTVLLPPGDNPIAVNKYIYYTRLHARRKRRIVSGLPANTSLFAASLFEKPHLQNFECVKHGYSARQKYVYSTLRTLSSSGVPRGGVWGVQTPPPEIPKISAESLIA